MNSTPLAKNLDIAHIAQKIYNLDKNLILIYAFNGTGKTRLSVVYKDLTKVENNDAHAGVYYNAYSEDLFYWDNDEENSGANIRLKMQPSALNQYHSLLDENSLRDKLSLYKPKYDFVLQFYENVEDGIESIQFFLSAEKSDEEIDTITENDAAVETNEADESDVAIKISRGEEQTFGWCFFLALFEVEGWMGNRSSHFFIDDPVSSLDDHNIFVTAASLMDLVDNHFKTKKIIITTHHVGFFAILADWLNKGEKAASYKKQIQMYILKHDGTAAKLINHRKDVFLYHLELLQTAKKAIDDDALYAYHFALLRQILENVGSFLGVGRISFVLEQIGIGDTDQVARIVNTLSHKNVFRYEAREMVDDNVRLFREIFDGLMKKYNFKIH